MTVAATDDIYAVTAKGHGCYLQSKGPHAGAALASVAALGDRAAATSPMPSGNA